MYSLTPQAPRRGTGLAKPQKSAVRLTTSHPRISLLGGAPRWESTMLKRVCWFVSEEAYQLSDYTAVCLVRG